MSFEYLKKLPSPEEIRKQYPITKTLAEKKAKRDQLNLSALAPQTMRMLSATIFADWPVYRKR